MKHLLALSAKHDGLTSLEIRILAFEYARELNNTMPQNWYDDLHAGKEWLGFFMRRHPLLSVRKPHVNSLSDDTQSNNQLPIEYRKYFGTVFENGRAFAKCLIKGCKRRLPGQANHISLRHFHVIHSEQLFTIDLQTCRLCFEEKDGLMDIFSDESNIASVIRLHFAPQEVKSLHLHCVFLLTNSDTKIRFQFFFFQVNENDSLPKHVCSACWSNVENFDKFYVAVNEAKDNYLAKPAQNVTSDFSEGTSDPLHISCKEEPPEDIEYVIEENNWSQNKNEENNWSQDTNEIEDIVIEASIDGQEFDTVFCKEFFIDSSTEIDDIKEETPVQLYADNVECPKSIASAGMIRKKSSTTTNAKSMCTANEQNRKPRKRSRNNLNSDLLCEFCEETFPSSNELQIHDLDVHHCGGPDRQMKDYPKRNKQ